MTKFLSNKGILRKRKPEFSFPELNNADNYLRGAKGVKLNEYIRPGEEEEAFGDNLKNPKFRKELRRLQEKHKLKGLA